MRKLMVFILLVLGLELVFSYACSAGTERQLFGSKQLFADLDRDGHQEKVKLVGRMTPAMEPFAGYIEYRIVVYNDRNQKMWTSPAPVYADDGQHDCTSVFLADIDNDGFTELVFSGRGLMSRMGGASGVIYKWKNGCFNKIGAFNLLRSADNPDIFRWKPLASGELSGVAKVKAAAGADSCSYVTLINLRKVNNAVWADLGLTWSAGINYSGLYAKVRLVPCPGGMRVAESHMPGESCRVISGDTYISIAYCFGPGSECVTAHSDLDPATLQADLDGDGSLESIIFKSYYPATGHWPRCQIFVKNSLNKVIWKSRNLYYRGDCILSDGEVPLPFEKLGQGQGGASLDLYGALVYDIDGDGKTELVLQSANRHGSLFERWRWTGKEFVFIGIGKLLKNADKHDTFSWYNNMSQSHFDIYSQRDMFTKESLAKAGAAIDVESYVGYISLSRLRREIDPKSGKPSFWADVDKNDGGGCSYSVRLEPIQSGFKVIEYNYEH